MLFGGETAESYYEEGITSAMRGDYPLAVQRLTRALELNSTLYHAHHHLGKCWLRLGQLDQAIRHFNLTVQYLPDSETARTDWGFALLYQRNISAAREKFSSALALNSESPTAVMGLAYCAFHEKQWDTAVSLVQRAIGLGRSHFDAHFLLARAADKAEQLELALPHYRRALELMNQFVESNPDQAPGYYLRARTYYSQRFYKETMEDCDTALQYVQPSKMYLAYHECFTSADILGLKGKSAYFLGNREESARIGQEILKLYPDNPLGFSLVNGVAPEEG